MIKMMVSCEEWDALCARNLRNQWSPPEDSSALAALEAAGYKDMLQHLRCLRNVFMEPRTSTGSRWTLPADPPARIDYIYASEDFKTIGRAEEPRRSLEECLRCNQASICCRSSRIRSFAHGYGHPARLKMSVRVISLA